MRDQRVTLACDIYTGSFLKSLAANFIGLMGVLEVFKDHDSVSPEAWHLIDD